MPSITPRILQELLDLPSLTTGCEQIAVSDLLTYLEAELAAQNGAELSPPMQLALENSLPCQQEYAEMKELLQRERAGQWREPQRHAEIDFSYLLTEATLDEMEEPAFWSFDKSGRLFIIFPADRVGLAQPQKPKEEYADLRAEEGPAILFADKIISDKDLEVDLTVRAVTEESAACTIVVKAHIPSRKGWPDLADTLVTLMCGQKPWPEQYTDEHGLALFEQFPVKDLANLTVVVESGPTDQ